MNESRGTLPNRNIELKARLAALALARGVAERVATSCLGTQHQVDTYFHVPHGRLKLREIGGRSAQLIAYSRADHAHAKRSEYHLVPVANPATLKAALAVALGVRAVVDKQREIFLHHNVRIHLDDVRGLGTFLEFEAVLRTDVAEEAGRRQVEELVSVFAIDPKQLVEKSYGELILAAGS